jgi:hypothetical protein
LFIYKAFVAFLNIYCQVKWRLGEGTGLLKFDRELIILLKRDLA